MNRKRTKQILIIVGSILFIIPIIIMLNKGTGKITTLDLYSIIPSSILFGIAMKLHSKDIERTNEMLSNILRFVGQLWIVGGSLIIVTVIITLLLNA